MTNHQKGLSAALFCFIFWGFAPLYFKLIQDAPALVIITHRIIWGALMLLLFLAIREQKTCSTVLKSLTTEVWLIKYPFNLYLV